MAELRGTLEHIMNQKKNKEIGEINLEAVLSAPTAVNILKLP
jgi:hypothetical protein